MVVQSEGFAQRFVTVFALTLVFSALLSAQTVLSGRVSDPQGKLVGGATVKLQADNGATLAETHADVAGNFSFQKVGAGRVRVVASAPGFAAVTKEVFLTDGQPSDTELHFDKLETQTQSVVITRR